MDEAPRRRFWTRAALVLGIWTLLALFLASQVQLILYSASYAEKDLPQQIPATSWGEVLAIQLAECYIWAGLSLIIFWLARRFPFERRRWPRSLLVHLAASVVVAVLQTGLAVLANELLRQDIPKPTLSARVLLLYFMAKLHQNVLIYWVILLAHQAVGYYRKYRDRELRASRLQARLVQTQLQVLKMQLHPHFLFNTLNAISALIHQDVDAADRMIARLGDLLRSTLENASKQEVSLREELDFIRPYLEIEQARLGSRLRVEFQVDPQALDARVPNLLLQPLVENAVRHGIAPRAGPGRIEVRARREDGRLLLEVQDDGPGLAQKPPAALKQGIGLTNTQARLEQLYGAAHHFRLSNGQGRGLTVSIALPFRAAAEDPGETGHEDSDVDCG